MNAKTILVPTDISENAKHAYPFALSLAKQKERKVLFLLSVEQPFDFALRAEERMRLVMKDAEQHFEELIEQYEEDEEFGGIELDYRIMSGKPVNSIISVAEQSNIKLIVMGTKGASSIKKYLFGSITSEVIRNSPVPVMVIPGESDPGQFSSVAYASNFEEQDIAILRKGIGLLNSADSAIHVVHVVKKKSLRSEIMIRGFKDLVESRLELTNLDFHLICGDDFYKTISEFQRSTQSDVLIMGRYHSGFLDDLHDRSETQGMSYFTKTPLLVIPAKAF